jgi:hypothetical protein
MLLVSVHGAQAEAVVDRSKMSVRGLVSVDPSVDLAAKQDPANGIAIRHVRLEPSTPVDGSPSVVLKFDLHNEGWTSVTDIVLAVSMRTRGGDNAKEAPKVRPFKIRIRNVLLAGYSFDYEIRLRNVSLDPAHMPEVEVVDAQRAVDDVF